MTSPEDDAPKHEFAFASFDSLEGVPVLSPAPAGTPGYLRLYRAAQRILPGGLIAVVVALAASWLSDHYGAPVMLFALLLGMAVNFVGQDPRCRPGIDFMGRTVLRLGVALLGARITIDQVSSLGGAPVLKPSPLPSWGLHTVDVNLALGNLVDLVGRQARRYASR